MTELARVRRYEAAGFRAWPAQATHYDGTWAVRLTASHPGKRLNSVNPLDPSDITHLDSRIDSLAQLFKAQGREFLFRLSPLSGRALSAHLDNLGWSTFDESMVMRVSLDKVAIGDAMDQIPLKDVDRFVGAALDVHGYDPSLRSGLAGIIAAIQPEAGLFVLELDDEPVATAICVHDGDLAGLFEIATDAAERGKGYGRRLILSALKWSRQRGASEAWLQVAVANHAAVKLYESIGFHEMYRYHYRRPSGS